MDGRIENYQCVVPTTRNGSPRDLAGNIGAFEASLMDTKVERPEEPAGWVLAIGFLGQIYWAFFGDHHSRQLFYVPFWSGSFWREVGQNPLAQLAMFFFITLGVSFMIVTGFALYAEGAQDGSLILSLFGWVQGLTWNSQRLHTLHHLGMWWIVIFMIVHIYVAIREDIMSRQSIVSTMISGTRTFKDDRPD